jgi:hypothetical protein
MSISIGTQFRSSGLPQPAKKAGESRELARYRDEPKMIISKLAAQISTYNK